jgi:CubicO group peptidase (beta-lactamase class C family)
LARTTSIARVALVVVLVAATACGDATSPPATPELLDLSAEWSTAAPAAEGLDEAALATTLGQAAAIPGLRSVLVVRHGRLIAEQYLGGGGADSLYALRSVTKSVISLLVGIAIDRGIIRGPSQPLGELFHAPLPNAGCRRGRHHRR